MSKLEIIKKITFTLLAVSLFSCQNSDVRRDSPEETTSILPKQTYISYTLPYEKYHNLLKRLEAKLKTELKNRGEAHITIITPPEYTQLKKTIPQEKLQQLSNQLLLMSPPFKEICLGMGVSKNNSELKTYYVVVSSEALLKFRKDLAEEAHLSKSDFDPDVFYPHITLGFTEKDLHLQDGVIKSKDSCPKELQKLLKK